MDLRPVNPYYREQNILVPQTGTYRLAEPYTYPYAWIEPVTDRKQEDVETVRKLYAAGWEKMSDKQKNLWLYGTEMPGLIPNPNEGEIGAASYNNSVAAGHKGALNRQDLIRIENNIQILMDVLEINGTSYAGKVPEFPTESYFARMKANVTAIREGYCVHETTPKVPELPYNTWEKYNAIEQILADVYEVVNAQFSYYAGDEIYAGDETGLLL